MSLISLLSILASLSARTGFEFTLTLRVFCILVADDGVKPKPVPTSRQCSKHRRKFTHIIRILFTPFGGKIHFLSPSIRSSIVKSPLSTCHRTAFGY